MTNDLILTYDASTNLTLRTNTPYGNFDFTGSVSIDWGDGSSVEPYTGGGLEHTYSTSGVYTITITGNITGLKYSCFEGVAGLTGITIPDTVTSMDTQCFYECIGLTSISIPDTITSIPYSGFYGCTSLVNVEIPSGITSLGQGAFRRCTSLTSVTIPDTVTSIGNMCFYSCIVDDYQLYWETSPLNYNSEKMPNNTNTVFTIPHGTTQLYVTAGYPVAKLVERRPTCLYDSNINTDTLEGALACLGKRITHHLTSKGITGLDYSDGLTSLADEILNLKGSSDTFLKLFAVEPIVEVGDTINLIAFLYDGFGQAKANEQITVSVGNSTYTSNTNSQGVASFSISDLSTEGTYSFTASYGSLTATCSVINAIFYDDATTDRNTEYYLNTTYTSISHLNNEYEVTLGSAGQYVDLRSISSSLTGKTVVCSVDVELPTGVSARLRTYELSNSYATQYISGSGTLLLENIAVGEATSGYFRIELKDVSDGDKFKFKNWTVYPTD